MMYFKEKLLKEGATIHLETEEQANALCKWLHFKNEKWSNGVSYLEETYWKVYKDNTCYRIYGGAYGDLDYYKEANIPVISFAEAIDLDMKQIVEPTVKIWFQVKEDKLTGDIEDDWYTGNLSIIDTRDDNKYFNEDYCEFSKVISITDPTKKEKSKTVELSHADIFKAISQGAVLKFVKEDGIINYWGDGYTIDKYQICYNYTGTDKDEWLQMKERK